MPVSKETVDSMLDQLNSQPAPEPVQLAKEDETRASVGGKGPEATGEDLLSRFKRGVRGGDVMLKTAIYGLAGPVIPEKGVAGDIARRIMTPVFEGEKQKLDEAARKPQTFGGKLLGGGAEGIGGIVTMPMPGGVVRNLIAGFGMGEGAEIGGAILRGIGRYFGGEKGAQIGEETGQIVGGAAGTQLNVTRVAAMGEAMKQAGSAVKAIPDAYRSAKALKAAGDSRALWSIFADEFGSLRANTQGIVQQFVNRNLAAQIRKDIYASKMAEDFLSDSKMTGIDVKPWGLGERTMVPTITETIAGARPGSFSEASEISGRAKDMQKSIGNAYDKLVDTTKIPITKDGIEGSAKVFQAITQAKVDALTAETSNIKNRFNKLDASQEFQAGEQTRAIRDKMRDEAYARGSARYTDAEALWDAEGAKVSPGKVREDAKDILKEFYSKVDPQEVPPVVRNLISATNIKEGEKVAGGLILPADIASERIAAKEAEEAAGKDLSLKDANDLYKALGEARATATSMERYTAANRAGSLQKQLVDSIMASKASPEAKAAWQTAVEKWRTDYAERFQQGLGKALGKERGGAYEGREAVKSEKVMDEALSGATALAEFDRVFGTNPQANTILAKSLENKFRKEVFERPFSERTFESNLNAFKDKYRPGLERFPEVAEKIDRESANMFSKQSEKGQVLDRYKEIMGADVTQAVGPIQAKQMFQAALSDPIKMQRLMTAYRGAPEDLVSEVMKQGNSFKNGEYDPDALLTLLRSGKRTGESPSSMEMLFTKAFGQKEGERHLATLEAIANFTKRQAATDPRFLQAPGLLKDSPIKEATGQSMASWISAWRAQAARQTGATYFATLGLSRFANAKVQAAIERAKHRALYDPKTADAILEMVSTPMTEPLSMTTAKKIFGDIRLAGGQKLIDRLIDKDYVKSHVSRGLIYGAEKAMQEQDDTTGRTGARRREDATQER